MRAGVVTSLALLALAVAATGCSYGFDTICRAGELCDPIEVEPPPTHDPNVGQGSSCDLMLGRCGDEAENQACSFTIVGDSIPSAPVCRSASGSSSEGRSCMDHTQCGLGLSCYKSDASADGVCVDLCQTASDCVIPSPSCDRSAPIATVGGVPFFRCVTTHLAGT